MKYNCLVERQAEGVPRVCSDGSRGIPFGEVTMRNDIKALRGDPKVLTHDRDDRRAMDNQGIG
jgi:hypothetical protein